MKGPHSWREAPQEVEPDDFVSEADVQRRLGVGIFGVNRLIVEGHLRSARLAGTTEPGVTAKSVADEMARRAAMGRLKRFKELIDFLAGNRNGI